MSLHSPTLMRGVIVVMILSCASLVSATGYYMQDFFPIGFTGFDHTGYWSLPDTNSDGSPYPDNLTQYPYGTWAKERELLDSTQCNFIGCSDGTEYYYLKADPSLTDPNDRTDFYNKVCLPAGIMLATNAGFMPKRVDWDNNDTLDTTSSQEYHAPMPIRWWTIFRTPDYDGGYGPWAFDTCYYGSIPQASIWCPMAEYGAKSYAAYFDSTGVSADNFWGYNPFHESYAMYRGVTQTTWKPGVYAADTFVTNAIRQKENGAPFNGTHRMMIAKGQLDKNITLNYNPFKSQTI